MLCFRQRVQRKMWCPQTGHGKRAALVPATFMPHETHLRRGSASVALIYARFRRVRLTRFVLIGRSRPQSPLVCEASHRKHGEHRVAPVIRAPELSAAPIAERRGADSSHSAPTAATRATSSKVPSISAAAGCSNTPQPLRGRRPRTSALREGGANDAPDHPRVQWHGEGSSRQRSPGSSTRLGKYGTATLGHRLGYSNISKPAAARPGHQSIQRRPGPEGDPPTRPAARPGPTTPTSST